MPGIARPIRLRLLLLAASLSVAGCPPTGEPPPFDPVTADATSPDVGEDARTLDGDLGDEGVAPECDDLDGDGFVAGLSCALPPGDCAPNDGQRFPTAPERCNGQDDDCDTLVDEGEPESGERCDTGEPGICAAGTTECQRGEVQCVRDQAPSPRETCNGDDDDCDGQIDEGNPDGGRACDTELPGECASGRETCLEGELRCVPNEEAGTELCNGDDDDCDGEVDEGNPGGGVDCEAAGEGLCRRGVRACREGNLICVPGTAVAEVCNGLDDDCDGQTDETWAAQLDQPCESGQGVCRREGLTTCAAGGQSVTCGAQPGSPADELCNGLDDDCDGQTDEIFSELGDECFAGQGACRRSGVFICQADAVACNAVPGASSAETCNAVDDDCDGQVDEDFPTLGDNCVDTSGQCPSPGALGCGPGGGVVCLADPVSPRAETCNAFDDDCDGQTDEDFPELGQACTSGVGACARPGLYGCNAEGAAACLAEPGSPTAELCNGQDDDCDGRVDNGAACDAPPTGRVIALRIAEFDEGLCPDQDDDGLRDNGLGAVAGLFNEPLQASVASGQRALLLRMPGYPDEAVGLEVLEAEPTADGLWPLPSALTASGAARHTLNDLSLVAGALSTPTPGASLQWPSPLFYDRTLPQWSALTLTQVSIAGTVTGEDGLGANGLVLSGRLSRAAVLASYREAEAACALAGDAAAPGCTIFAQASADSLEANLHADLDDETVSACLVLSLVEAPGSSLPVGGGRCERDDDCYAGLLCRPQPVTDDPALGAALGLACGIAPGDGAQGATCDADDDCQRGLCVAATASGGRCSTLCEADADCGAGRVCRGVALEVEGALTQGGSSARVCVPITGSGSRCANTCLGAEICGLWLAGGVGQPGEAVTVEGRCQTADPLGTAVGQLCQSALDCAHGNGCVPGLDGALRCAQPCSAPDRCAGASACTDRAMLDAVGGEDPLLSSFCLPVPAALGSGRSCTRDLDCPGAETCYSEYLASSQTIERFCTFGPGFASVGQPCTAGTQCASGRCLGGLCSGLCTTSADCGSALGCVANALVDDDNHTLGGLCNPASAACALDRDCTTRDPLCAGDRCVCEAGRCRIGCRHPGACVDAGLYCQENGQCAPFCRDDEVEPNDQANLAWPLTVGRAAPSLTERRQLCGRSPEDWFTFNTGGWPFQVRVTPLTDAPQALLALHLETGLGVAIADGVNQGGELVADISDPAVAAALASGTVRAQVRASGLLTAFDYELTVTVELPEWCDDGAEEPADDPWAFTELAKTPGGAASETVSTWICPQDEDWYAVWLGNGDQLTVDFAALGNGGALETDDLVLDLVGPDHPTLSWAGVISTVANQGQLVYSPPAISCQLDAARGNNSYCRYADGTWTEIFCGGGTCEGAPFFLQVRGASAADASAYDLDVQVLRAVNLLCVPDPMEYDNAYTTLERVHAAVGPDSVAESSGQLTLPADQDVVVSGIRACGENGSDGYAADADNYLVWLNPGEKLKATVRQLGAPQSLQLDFYKVTGPVVTLTQEVFSTVTFTDEVVADTAAYYAAGVLRGKNRNADPAYLYSHAYELTLRRVSANAVTDNACAAPDGPLSFILGRPFTVTGTTAGSTNDHQPLACAGGAGPDRVYALALPAGAGTLGVTVTGDADHVDPAVYVRAACDAEVSEYGCNEDDPTVVDPYSQAAVSVAIPNGAEGRRVYIVVDSFSPQTAGPFRMRLTWTP